MEKNSKIFVAGHRGMVGSAIVHVLKQSGYHNLVLRTRTELDLRDSSQVAEFFQEEKPYYVFLAAATVGGIMANSSSPAEFIYDNLAIQTNVIHQSYVFHAKKLLVLGSSCIYPRECPQPIREDYLLTGPLEPTNQWYAVAKIAGVKMCQAYRKQYGCDFICAMPTNLYGPGDNFDPERAHVLPALLHRFHDAKQTGKRPTLWGTGRVKREFLHVDDCAEACLFLMEHYSDDKPVNIGSGTDSTIAELAKLVADVVCYTGEVDWDISKPDGTPRKLLDTRRIRDLGWQPKVSLRDGVRATYQWYTQQLCHHKDVSVNELTPLNHP